MSKSKINFEIEQEHLTNAKIFVARHGGSLNKLVSAYFASLGRDEATAIPALNPSMRVLIDVVTGKTSAVDAARELKLPDAGYVLHMIRDAQLPLPKLPDDVVVRQVAASLEALRECLIDSEDKPAKGGKRKVKQAHA